MGSDLSDPVRHGWRAGAIRDDLTACQTDLIPLALSALELTKYIDISKY